jgi:hypothetical protein
MISLISFTTPLIQPMLQPAEENYGFVAEKNLKNNPLQTDKK